MSHYKNGREAINGEPVIGKLYGQLITGVIYGINPSTETCNCTVAQIVPGGVMTVGCVNVKDLYHVEDALAAIEPKVQPATEVVPPPPMAWNRSTEPTKDSSPADTTPPATPPAAQAAPGSD